MSFAVLSVLSSITLFTVATTFVWNRGIYREYALIR